VENSQFRDKAMNYPCPICGKDAGEVFLKREDVPVNQNYLFEKERSAIEIARGRLSIAICHNCGFVFNTDFNENLLSYNESYENTQSYSPAFEAFLDDNINYLIDEKGIRNCRVIEVGCGKGSFIRKLVERGHNTGIGFDPSYVGPLEMLGGKLKFVKRFYDQSSSDLTADVVICRHVIEHIAKPLDLLKSIRQALAKSPKAQVFFETPDVKWILQVQVVWDFFYEHCSYFSPTSIRTAFESSGYKIEEIRNVFGGQYLWVEARPSPDRESSLSEEEVKILVKLAQKFSEADSEQISIWKKRLKEIYQHGQMAVWGAGAKGVTFSNLFDPNKTLISCVIDVNPQKQSKFLPGTGHPIISLVELPNWKITSVIILNPNYRSEIENLLKNSGTKNIRIYTDGNHENIH
jgi:2-polyprenyl-3-methyl-5-hydroxy-6-metoxy-1,4-benzoquinol methylase